MFDVNPVLDGDGAGCDGRGECPGPGAEEPNNQVRNITDNDWWLTPVVFSGSKMLAAEGQTVYMLVDRKALSGAGAVVGMLKVGRKKLFLLDSCGKPNELSPLCVLDFYVTERRQRTGCGKLLFETMLRREGVEPRYLAIDRPSEKLISFLRKHYNLSSIIPQVNNYVIFSGFFKDQPADASKAREAKKPRIYMGKLQYV